ncbi:phage integrase SAM-like domain-containing protein, partial [Gemmatimonas aurantiaca]|nr:phage integrase SAM-like domain-containing protein [Gemmatimonas aurantiaca]
MAAIYLRQGSYYVDYSLHGRRVRKVIGSDRNAAEHYLREVEYRLYNGDFALKRPELPFDLAISRYLSDCKTRVASSSCERYNQALNHLHNYLLTHHPIAHIGQLSRSIIIQYPAYRMSCKPKPKNKTINNELVMIRAFLYFCLESEYISANPARKIKMLPEKDSKVGKIISSEDINLILSVSSNWFS